MNGPPPGVGFVLTDTSRRIIYVNDDLCRMSQKQRDDLVGVDLDVLLAERRWLQVIESHVYGDGGEYLGTYAYVRMVH